MNTFSKWKEIQSKDQQLSREMNRKQTNLNERIFGMGHYLRPHLIQFFECKNILVENVTITNSPFWCIHLVKSENATFRAINFIAKLINNDGIDPEYSKNILIENINFDNGDDNIAIKAGRDTEGRATAIPSENIIIRNCKFKGLHGLVIGSEMSAGVQNVFVENCSYGGYLKRGIFLKSNPDRGGFIRNIYVKNVDFGEVEDCFFITSFYHGEGQGHTTEINNVYVENVTCQKARNGGIVIQGFEGKPVTDIYFRNIVIKKAEIAVSLPNTEHIVMDNVNIGGVFSEAPSIAK
jgi:polygalacturonase